MDLEEDYENETENIKIYSVDNLLISTCDRIINDCRLASSSKKSVCRSGH